MPRSSTTTGAPGARRTGACHFRLRLPSSDLGLPFAGLLLGHVVVVRARGPGKLLSPPASKASAALIYAPLAIMRKIPLGCLTNSATHRVADKNLGQVLISISTKANSNSLALITLWWTP